MTRYLWAAACLLFAFSDAFAQGADTDAVERLFHEAQRYHLGVDRPRDIRQAYKLYTDVVKRQPSHASAYYNLAGLCFEQKRYDLASGYYRKVVELRPDDADALNNLGVVYDRQGKEDRAIQQYRKAIQADRNLPTAHYNLAQTYLKIGDLETALREVETAMRLSPDASSFVSLHGRILGEMGKLSNTTMFLVAGGFAALIIVSGIRYRRGMRA